MTSIAFPMLGADKGGLPINVSRELMRRYLSPLEDLEIEIYEYDPKAKDDLFEMVREFIISQDIAYLAKATGINGSRLETIIKAMTEGSVCQISQLGALPGIGPGTLEKLFALRNMQSRPPAQKLLFDN